MNAEKRFVIKGDDVNFERLKCLTEAFARLHLISPHRHTLAVSGMTEELKKKLEAEGGKVVEEVRTDRDTAKRKTAAGGEENSRRQ